MAGLDPATQPDARLAPMGGWVYMMASKRYGMIYVGGDSARAQPEALAAALEDSPGRLRQSRLKDVTAILIYYW